jgi:hypothetical protein
MVPGYGHPTTRYAVVLRDGSEAHRDLMHDDAAELSDRLSGRANVGAWLIGRIHRGENSRDRTARSVYVAGKVPHSIIVQ